jgi:DNA-directed RNA polymerase II subunit RPB2
MTQRGFVTVQDLRPKVDYLAVTMESNTCYPTSGDAQYVPVLARVPAANQQISDITVESPHHTFVTTGGIFSHNSSMGKQAMGVFANNAKERMDTMSNMLWYMSKPLVTTFMSKFFHSQTMPTGMNVIVAVMTYGGYNQEDSVMINRGFLDRGGFSSEFYRTYKDEEKKNQASGEEERFCCPNPTTTRHMKTANYDKLGPDGIVPVNTYVTDTDVLIGKVAPIRLRGADGASQAGIDPATLQSMSAMDAALAVEAAGGKRFRDNSKMLRANEKGFVDQIYRGRNSEGYSFVKIRTREARRPEIGDKFASRHGQKGTCGMILEPEDMPQTASGIVPDIIINPHCLVSRMTVAHILESLLGRLGCELASLCDATPFNPHMTRERISELLLALIIQMEILQETTRVVIRFMLHSNTLNHKQAHISVTKILHFS